MGAAPPADTDGIVVAREGSRSDGHLWVVAQAEAEIVQRYGFLDDVERELTAAMFDPPDGVFLVARRGDAAGPPVGGAGVRAIGPGIGEVRRLWVDPGFRRRGIARLLLAELEDASREIGLRTLRLSTGDRQPEAVGLYVATGWRHVALDKSAEGFRFSKKLGGGEVTDALSS
jgi:GNAT superfamily N-acetyltransferase